MSLLDHLISQPNLDISPIWTPLSQHKSRDYNLVKCGWSGKFCFSCVGTIRSIASLRDDFNQDTSLLQGFISVEFQ
jgi:hypothetical protein